MEDSWEASWATFFLMMSACCCFRLWRMRSASLLVSLGLECESEGSAVALPALLTTARCLPQ